MGAPRRSRKWIIGALIGGCLSGCQPANDGVVELRYMAWGNPQQLEVEKELCREFNRQHPNIRVKFIQTPSSDYFKKMLLMLASRTAPDVMRVDHYNFPALVGKNYFRPLDDLIANDPTYKLKDYFPVAVDESRAKGQIYGVDVLLGSPVIYYNRDLIRKANLEDPFELWQKGEWTWDRYVSHAKAMTTKDANGRPKTFGSFINSFPYQLAVVYSFGGQIMDDAQQRVVLAEGKAKEAFRFLYDLRFKHKAEPSAAQAANSLFSFEGGKLGMSIDWMGATPRLRDAAKFDWDVCPIPMNPGGTPLVKGNHLCLFSGSKHPKETWEFMKFMTGRSTENKLYVDYRRSFPTRKDVAYSPRYFETGGKPPRNLKTFVTSIERGKILPITSRWSEWQTEFNSGIDPLFNGSSTNFDGLLAEGQKRANDTLAVREGL